MTPLPSQSDAGSGRYSLRLMPPGSGVGVPAGVGVAVALAVDVAVGVTVAAPGWFSAPGDGA